MLQYLATNVLHLGLDGDRYVRACVIAQLSALIFHRCFCHTSIAVHSLQPPMNLRCLAALCAQKLNQSSLILLGRMWNATRHIF
jgi:hypothetical protein